MNKGDLVAQIAERTDLTKVKAEQVVEAFTDAVKECLSAGDNLKLVGFGTFSVSNRKARKGRNPKTGVEIDIAAKKIAKFTAGTKLNEIIS